MGAKNSRPCQKKPRFPEITNGIPGVTRQTVEQLKGCARPQTSHAEVIGIAAIRQIHRYCFFGRRPGCHILARSFSFFATFSATCLAPMSTNGTPFPGRLPAPTNKTFGMSEDSAPGRVRLS